MKQVILFIILTSSLSCEQAGRASDTKDILFEQYFPLRSNEKKIFYVSRPTDTDTLMHEIDSSFCISNMIMDREIFYFTDEPRDSTNIIGSESFCDGVFYFKDGEFFVSPIFWQVDLKQTNLAYFERLFPKMIVLDSIYKQQHGDANRRYTFDRIEDVSIKGKLLQACLRLTIIQNWPTDQYVDTVWFQKNIGVVKWLRSTGRLEEIKM